MQVDNVMQKTVVTVTPEMSLAAVQHLMREQRIRHLPVVSGKKLVGIVTDRDIREAVPSPATTLSRGEIAYQIPRSRGTGKERRFFAVLSDRKQHDRYFPDKKVVSDANGIKIVPAHWITDS